MHREESIRREYEILNRKCEHKVLDSNIGTTHEMLLLASRRNLAMKNSNKYIYNNKASSL